MINKRREGVINRHFLINCLKVVICAAVAFAVAKLVDIKASMIGTGTILTLVRLCICALPAFIAYIIAGYLIGVDEIRNAADLILKKRKD